MVNKREKILIGGVLLLGSIFGIGLYMIWPAIGSIQSNIGKIAAKEAEVAQMEVQITALNNDIKSYEKLQELPKGLKVRAFKPDTLQANIKGMVDQVVTLSTLSGNELISLEPFDAPEPLAPPPKAEDASDKSGKTPPKKAAKGEAQELEVAEEVTPPILETFGYQLTVRGSYDNIMGFIASMNSHNELVEIQDIKLENEGGEDRGTEIQPGKTGNPFKPIMMTSKLVLFLQPSL